jgi:hypothetical protein
MVSNKQDRIGEWFVSKQAQRLGLAFTIIFGLLTAAVAVAK